LVENSVEGSELLWVVAMAERWDLKKVVVKVEYSVEW
jgi:hypothetical protein